MRHNNKTHNIPWPVASYSAGANKTSGEKKTVATAAMCVSSRCRREQSEKVFVYVTSLRPFSFTLHSRIGVECEKLVGSNKSV